MTDALATSGSNPSWGPLISILGGAITTLIGVLIGSILGRRNQKRQWLLDSQLQASAAVLREYQKVTRALRKAIQSKAHPDLDWRPWDESLTVLSLVGDDQAVTAAQNIDNICWRIGLSLRDGKDEYISWLDTRAELESAVVDFINKSRAQLGYHRMPVEHFLGRPEVEDGIWPTRLMASEDSNPKD